MDVLGLRAPHRSAFRSGRARRRPRRRLRRDRPVTPGHRVLEPAAHSGIGVTQTADLWVRLMRDVLGYDRFGAGGGDSGAFVSSWLGHAYAAHVIGSPPELPAPISMAALGTIRVATTTRPRKRAWLTDTRAHARGTDRATWRADRGSADARVGDERLTGRTGSLDRSNGAATGATATATSSAASRRTTCSRPCRSTGSPSVPHVGPLLRRVVARPWPPSTTASRRSTVPTAVAVFPTELIRVPRRSWSARRTSRAGPSCHAAATSHRPRSPTSWSRTSGRFELR